MNRKKLVTRLKSRRAKDVRLRRVGQRAWSLSFVTYKLNATMNVDRTHFAFKGRTLRSLAMKAGLA